MSHRLKEPETKAVAVPEDTTSEGNFVEVKKESAASLVKKIKSCHTDAQAAGNDADKAVLKMLNRVREAGLYLATLREQTPHGEWEKLFTSEASAETSNRPRLADFDFSLTTAKRYMAVGERYPDKIKKLPGGVHSLNGLIRALGISTTAKIEGATKGPETVHAFNGFIEVTNSISQLAGVLKFVEEKAPLAEWDADQRIQLREKLRPMAELYVQLGESE